MPNLAHNRTQVLSQIQISCQAAGRAADPPRVIAVTKSVSCEWAAELFGLGCQDLGENRLPEFERKHAWFAERGLKPTWHFIGHIQRNKARRIALLADEIHSVDSLRLLEALIHAGADAQARPGLYLQLKLNDEPNKGGLLPTELPAALELLQQPGALPLLGLMTMAPLIQGDTAHLEAPRAAARTFQELARIAAKLSPAAFQGERAQLSMGMSGDFDQAIQAGAHAIRIGSAFFHDQDTAPKETKN